MILTGKLTPGDKISERALADNIGVSRTPVREALRRLRHEGLITSERYKRNFVARHDEEDVQEIFKLRSMLEAYGAKRAATRITEEELAKLCDLQQAMDALLVETDWQSVATSFDSLNFAFHQIIVNAANSSRLPDLLSHPLEMPLVYQDRYGSNIRKHLERTCFNHWEIIAALKRRDPNWAESQMRTHLLSLVLTSTD